MSRREIREKPFFPKLVAFSRVVHIYLTMLGLLVILLFSITGLTINHEEWFGATHPIVREEQGQTPGELISSNDRLRIVEHLRKAFPVHGAVTSYDSFEDQIMIAFKAPGEIWEFTIEKRDGLTSAHQELFNFAAIVNNLHRGRYAGKAWRWVIDISAILILLACLTGFILWLALPRRRKAGIAWLVLGTLTTIAVIYWLVPGSDANIQPRPNAELMVEPLPR